MKTLEVIEIVNKLEKITFDFNIRFISIVLPLDYKEKKFILNTLFNNFPEEYIILTFLINTKVLKELLYDIPDKNEEFIPKTLERTIKNHNKEQVYIVAIDFFKPSKKERYIYIYNLKTNNKGYYSGEYLTFIEKLKVSQERYNFLKQLQDE